MTREGTRRSPVRMLMIRIILRVVLVIVRMRVIVHQASVAMFVGMDDDSSASLAFRADGRVYLPDPSAFGTLGALAHFFSPFIRQATGVHDLDPESDSHLHDCPPLFFIDSVLLPEDSFRSNASPGFEIVGNMVLS
jgi:hypothetical protein